MKIQKQVTPQFEEVEVELPIYRKTSDVRCHFAKVFSERACLWVTVGGTPSLSICSSSLAMNSEYVECTAEEFNKAYEEIETKLSMLK